MVTSYGHTQCVAHDFLEQDPWLRTASRLHHHGNVHAPVEQRALEVVAGEIQKRHAHAWRSCLKCRQRAGKNFSGRRRGVTDAEFTGLAASQGTNGLQSLVGAVKHGACFIGKEFSSLGEFDSTCAAFKQFHAKLLFEMLDLPTQRRLGDVKPPRRPRHVAKLGDGYKVTQMAKFHSCIIPEKHRWVRNKVLGKPWAAEYPTIDIVREYENVVTYSTTQGDHYGRSITRTR